MVEGARIRLHLAETGSGLQKRLRCGGSGAPNNGVSAVIGFSSGSGAPNNGVSAVIGFNSGSGAPNNGVSAVI
ncbi:hypothetical protein A3844_16535 [Paenibacillus helianthi]|uniref:Uncharacterized protein n=1 Tax=Paenibacillus helianthi TaxID=1349432 RepID=A0ABX3EPV1_9BACL|nr:hypothetical protein [Paenibacillus helianthi]OKP85394.1 hypothetical protein A3844_16535 [Paenibacillus helianthi]